MAKSDSFILYLRYGNQLEMLTMEERGELITAIFAWVRGEQYVITSAAVRMAFAFISEQLDFDLGKYEKRCAQNRENILKRYERTKASPDTDNTSVIERIQSDTDAYLSDSCSDSVSCSDSYSDSVSYVGEEDACAQAGAPSHGEENTSALAEDAPSPAPAKAEREEKNKKRTVKTKYGSYKNVPLSDGDITVLKASVPNFGVYIERMSRYIEASGKRYRSCCAALLGWYEADRERGVDITAKVSEAFNPPKVIPTANSSDSFDTDDFFAAALRRSYSAVSPIPPDNAPDSGMGGDSN
ncbi:MAG: DUF6291 domain-containing protein [Eubacteriales bacterium]